VPSKAWIWRIKKGDVLKWPNGVLRVVRHVSHYTSNKTPKCSVTFAIRHCSWTGRPTTTYSGHDLAYMGVRPTRAKVTLRKKIDRAIEADFSGRIIGIRRDGSVWRGPLLPPDCVTHCCDVIGKVN
jgi:hypothetical protein